MLGADRGAAVGGRGGFGDGAFQLGLRSDEVAAFDQCSGA